MPTDCGKEKKNQKKEVWVVLEHAFRNPLLGLTNEVLGVFALFIIFLRKKDLKVKSLEMNNCPCKTT